MRKTAEEARETVTTLVVTTRRTRRALAVCLGHRVALGVEHDELVVGARGHLRGSGLAFEHAQDVSFLHDQEFLTIDLDLAA